MKRLALIVIVACATILAISVTTVQASLGNCTGLGLTPSNLQFGTCTTDQNGGSGSVSFSGTGLNANLEMKTQRGSHQTASFWSSNGSIGPASSICLTVDVSRLEIKGGGYVQQVLLVSYNYTQQIRLTASVLQAGAQQPFCAYLPAGAGNVVWQLITIAGGDKPSSQVRLTETLAGVSYGS